MKISSSKSGIDIIVYSLSTRREGTERYLRTLPLDNAFIVRVNKSHNDEMLHVSDFEECGM